MSPTKLLAAALLATLVACAGWAEAAPRAARPASAGAAHAGAAAQDVRDPATLIAALAPLGAKAAVARREGDSVFLTVSSPAESFSAQFAGCDAQGRACQAVLFDALGQAGAPTSAQLNAFNQTSVMCRLYEDKSGRPHVEYSTLLFARDGRAELTTHLGAWRGCLGDFAAFQKDPAGFLAGAP